MIQHLPMDSVIERVKKENIRRGFYLCLLILLCVLNTITSSFAQICSLSDEFTSSALDPSWQQFQQQFQQVTLSDGYLILDLIEGVCNNNCPWFHAQSAGFLYKPVTGDFELVGLVESIEASGPNAGADISNDTQLGGLMARDPNASVENYVFNVVGTRFDIPSIETKSTTNDHSGTIEPFAINDTRAELRMTREGSTFRMYSRDVGATAWIHRSTFIRPCLPATLQVGVIAYVFQSYPEDLAVRFDYVRFSEFSQENKWMGGAGLWGNASMWSRLEIPDSLHRVIIDNPQAQTIQILSGESFRCYELCVVGDLTELIVDGELEVGQHLLGCD